MIFVFFYPDSDIYYQLVINNMYLKINFDEIRGCLESYG
jgi:hypothetical protein